jgi:hypothetical protein
LRCAGQEKFRAKVEQGQRQKMGAFRTNCPLIWQMAIAATQHMQIFDGNNHHLW